MSGSMRLSEAEFIDLQQRMKANRPRSPVISWPPPYSEKKWEADVEGFMGMFGWRFYHTRRSDDSVENFPDLVALRHGRSLIVELKVLPYLPTAGQLDWLDAFSRAGHESYVWWPHDLDEVMRVLR